MKLTQIIEALLFAAHEPLSANSLAKTIRAGAKEIEGKQRERLLKTDEKKVEEALKRLNKEFEERKSALVVLEGPTGWKYYTRPEYAQWVRHLFPAKKPDRLSAPALETLAIIAYRQPITRADMEAVRGVSVDGVLQKLIDRGLAHITGRAEVPGRPLLYETTAFFLEHFGIKNLEELPNATELKYVELPTAETKAGGEGESDSEEGKEEREVSQEDSAGEDSEEKDTAAGQGEQETVSAVGAGEGADG